MTAGGDGLGATAGSAASVIRVTEAVYSELISMAKGPVESAAVLLARVDDEGTATQIVVTAVHPVPEYAYHVRTDRSLEVSSDGYMPALAAAETQGAVAIWVHTHPGDGAKVAPSRHDLQVNSELLPVFALRSSPAAYGWMVLGHQDGHLSFTGALEFENGAAHPVTRMSVVGARFQRIVAQDNRDRPAGREESGHEANLPDLFDRNIRALGTEVQKVINDLTLAVVGAGGTGSAVAEQLVRLGARHIVLIDPDTLSASNTTRVYGSTPADVGRHKVDVLADHLARIAPDLDVRTVVGSITKQSVARLLAEADVVFGCTDDNAGRLRLSRLPYYYLIPVIDCGIKLDSDTDDIISGIFGRVTIVYPGTACLLCRDRVDTAMADAEVRTAEEHGKLMKEGYAPALPGVEPALVPFTTMTAAWAVSEFLERLIGYGEDPSPSELLMLIHERRISGNAQRPTVGHYCDPDTDLEYDRDMFLGMNWSL
ncbi:ThiF family adenylyltransferase [Williamsia herbipolensis]|uniref:ThiF family adenylyltransferase n=1 Tax=Williamsia herbipolensis TaxID=1603258 RepID=UPI0005F86BBC|nr:ThiF family adenylyltransferase [Williamsia herbipolensis]